MIHCFILSIMPGFLLFIDNFMVRYKEKARCLAYPVQLLLQLVSAVRAVYLVYKSLDLWKDRFLLVFQQCKPLFKRFSKISACAAVERAVAVLDPFMMAPLLLVHILDFIFERYKKRKVTGFRLPCEMSNLWLLVLFSWLGVVASASKLYNACKAI